MAANLLKAGYEVTIWNRTTSKAEALLPLGARIAASPAEAAGVDILITMLEAGPQVESVLDVTLDQIAAGSLVIDMSSTRQAEAQSLHAKLNKRGIHFMDAPVSGGEVGARAASLTIMVGGPEAVFDAVKPLFELMGKNITLVGGNGDGQTCKVANQIIVALNIAAVGEALLFASKAGADPAKVRQALMGGFAASRILEVHGERMIKRTFAPGFRIGLHQKDLSLALSGARALGVALPQTAGAAQLMQVCSANGMQDLDHSALVRSLELMAAHEVAKA